MTMKTFLILSILPIIVNGYASRKTSFVLKPNHHVSYNTNNLLSGPFSTRSLMECGVLCETNDHCDVAEYDKSSFMCKLYKDIPKYSMILQQANGIAVLRGIYFFSYSRVTMKNQTYSISSLFLQYVILCSIFVNRNRIFIKHTAVTRKTLTTFFKF